MLNQQDLNKFYQSSIEHPDDSLKRLEHLRYSGLSLVKKIAPGETVIDIGCGNNIFKKYIPLLIGIDPVYDAADYKIDLQNFITDKKFNVAFCLGSIQHGDVSDIEQQIAKVVSLLTPKARIYWRVRPGTSKINLNKFPWTLDDQYMFAKKFGFQIVEHSWDTLNTDDTTLERLYVEWVRT